MDLCFELATKFLSVLGSAVTVIDELQGFRYFDMRSIIGFVDGTEKPVDRKAVNFTILGDEDPSFSCYENRIERRRIYGGVSSFNGPFPGQTVAQTGR